MARQIGSTFRGTTWDGLTFYHNRLHGNLVRRTGGVTSKRYHRDARYAGARDASREFSLVSGAGKLIRQALGEFVPAVKDGSMVNRMNRELVALKQLDTLHHRGERRPETMMCDPAANVDFRIFQFNEAVKLYDLTEQYPSVETCRTDSGGRQSVFALRVSGVRLKTAVFPERATHAGITLIRAVIDFESGGYRTSRSRMAVVLPGEACDLSVAAEDVPFNGTELVCVQVLFFRRQGGDLVPLKGAVHSMGVVAVNRISVVAATGRASQDARGRVRRARRYLPGCHRAAGTASAGRSRGSPRSPLLMPFIPPPHAPPYSAFPERSFPVSSGRRWFRG